MPESAAWKVVSRGILLAFLLVALAVLVGHLQRVIMQLLLAILFAAALNPLVNAATRAFERSGWRWKPGRGVIAVAVFFLALIALVGVLMAIVATVVPDLRNLAINLPAYVQRAQETLNGFIRDHPELSAPLSSGTVPPQFQIQDVLAGVAALATRAPQVASVATSAFGEVLYVFFALILALYLVIDGERIRRYVLEFLPDGRQSQALQVTERIGGRLGAWARGEALLGAIIGGMTWTAALILGLPYAGALAFMAALGELVPGIGPIIAAVPLITVGFFASPTQGLIAIAVAIGIQQLENNVIVPRIMSQAVDLHPLVVMLAILVGSELLGVLGALLAVPIAASLAVVVDEFQRERLGRRLNVPGEDIPPS
jgi:predicted PurR-regulated permease PerM